MCDRCNAVLSSPDHTKAPVREWRVTYQEMPFRWTVFQRWFHSETQAQAFAARHNTFAFPAKITHIPYGR